MAGEAGPPPGAAGGLGAAGGPDAVSAARLQSQLLAGPPVGSVAAVAGRLLAVQAQDRRGARLAVRARSAGLTAADVDRALTVERSVVVGWLNRGTLHLVRSGDYWWLHSLTAPPMAAAIARRLSQLGVTPGDAERGVAVIERSLTAHGPLTRAQVRESLARRGVPAEGQALVHLLGLASLRGVALRGPVVGAEQAYVLARDWIGPPAAPGRERALAELARRYLAGHGPAADRDLATWAGLPVGDARRGLASIAAGLADHGDGLVSLAGTAPDEPPPAPPRLLGAFDPLLLGWRSRDPVLGRHVADVVSGGVFRAFALVGGRAAGLWSIKGRAVELNPFAPLAPRDAAALRSEADDVARFLGRA